MTFTTVSLTVWRTSKTALIISIVLFGAGIVLYQEFGYIVCLLSVWGVIDITDIFIKPQLQLIQKRKKGLFIPVTSRQIFLSGLPVPLLLNSILAAVFCTVLCIPPVIFVSTVFGSATFVFLSFYIRIKYGWLQKNYK